MKPVNELLSELHKLEVKFWVEGDRLKYSAPKGVLSPTLLAHLRERKADILTFLLHQTNSGASEASQAFPTPYPEATAVEKVSNLAYSDFVSQYLNPLRPVVITDAIQNWEALSKWSPEFLKETLGFKEIMVEDSPYQFGAFLDAVIASTEAKPAPYLRDADIPGLFPELLPDIQPPLAYAQYNWLLNPLLYIPSADRAKQQSSFLELLIAGRGTNFPVLHFDYWHLHAFIMQLHGEKEFTLYSPEQTEYLYPTYKSSNKSLIPDVHSPNLKQFPLLEKATPIRVILQPGETIFVPSGWWHTTRILTASIAVTVNSLTSSNWKPFSQDIASDFVGLALTSKNAQSNLSTVKTSTSDYLDSLGNLLKSFE